MTFVKIQKNAAYFKRYQTKPRRRQQCKTDYYARRRLVAQDKNKYNSPRYRFVVRITNRDIIVQVVYAKIIGDQVLAAAYAHELPIFGAKVGLTNYAACYATGLLAARRVLTKLKLADKYQGATDATKVGADYTIDPLADGPRPFKCLLDVGLARTTTGARLFGALKGGLDGGLNIPHSDKRFPGYNKEKGELNSDAHRARIFGLHVAEYQKSLQADDADRYNKLFSRYAKEKVNPDAIEALWKGVHAAIRKEPTKTAEKKKKPEGKPPRHSKKALTKVQRVHRRDLKRAVLQSRKAAE